MLLLQVLLLLVLYLQVVVGKLDVPKCNLGKVSLKPMQSAVSPICVRDLRGDPLEFAACLVACFRFVSLFSGTLRIICVLQLIVADLSLAAVEFLAIAFCESLWILAMSRTRNSRDAGLVPQVAPAVLPDVSVQSSQPATVINSAVTSVASPLTAAQLSPDCLAAIVQAVRASIATEGPHVSLLQSSSLPTSVAVAGMSCSSLPVLGGVPGLDLGVQVSALQASGVGFSPPPSPVSTLSSQNHPNPQLVAFILDSFAMVSSWASTTLKN